MTRNSKKAKPPKGSKCWYCGQPAVRMSTIPNMESRPMCKDLDGCTRYMMSRNGQPWGLSGGAK